jgi:hypothetical protein
MKLFSNQLSNAVLSRRGMFVCRLFFIGLLVLSLTPGVWAQEASGDVTVQIDKESAALMAGDWLEFNTVLRNEGAVATPPLVAHLNIAALTPGKHVDPEDWSPVRTQYLPSLQPGETAELSWKLHVLFEGEFASFVTIVAAEKSFNSVTSPSLRLQVEPDNILPMNEVVPVAIVVPFFPLGLLLFSGVYARRRQ